MQKKLNIRMHTEPLRDPARQRAMEDTCAPGETPLPVLDHLPAGVVVHGSDGHVLSANHHALELLGRSVDEAVGLEASAPAWHFVRADGTPMPPHEFPANHVLRTGEPVRDLVVGLPAPVAGGVRWMLANAYPERREGRLRAIVCFTDCTALHCARLALQHSEQRLALALRGSTDAPWDWDIVSGATYYSPRWWELLGYAPGEHEADAATWIRMAHPDDQARLSSFMAELPTNGREYFGIEFRLRHRAGHDVPVLARGYILRDAGGRALRMSGTTSDLTERKHAERRIYELAYFDHLTGLPNRRFLAEELGKVLARAARSQQYGAVMFLDLDNFKLLNDTMGHDVGDVLLRQVAARLRAALRESDHLARLGGDEFVVVLENLGTCRDDAIGEAQLVSRRILDALGVPFDLVACECSTSPSIGTTLFDGDRTGIDTLLKQADLAMYRAKADGRNTMRFFDPGMQEAAARQAALDGQLRDGLARRQFVLHCQPQFATDGRLAGAEALVRWQRDGADMAAPVGAVEFIDQAEASGLIVPIGMQVLEESCGLLARWARDPRLAALPLAVNVSVRQLRDPAFPDALAGMLAASGAPPARLTLEITENVFAAKLPDLIPRMQRLNELGVQFALDDFGTGPSSLAYLQDFPFATLKIGRALVHAPYEDGPGDGAGAHGRPLVEAIVALARKLDLGIIAEDVEHESQRSLLADCGCDVLQGYLLGRPVPAAEFERMYGGAGTA
jgi:diguanylate cyclase (GGDEF)-like protein/PAS domain S-box-containing protein